MPWRKTRDPYAIWVSEIMLQQTRVETVRGYYARWMERLPTVRALAEAPLDEVLALWSGLGYYARARNLKAAAEVLLAQDGGSVPADPVRLLALPGVGAYTAGAIASIAFDLPEPILDGNVARVLSRVFAIDTPPEAKDTKMQLWARARALVPPNDASHFNQSMMELGATLCSPRAPVCEKCPLAKLCRAHALGLEEQLPLKKQKREVPLVDELALVVRSRDAKRLLLARRPARGLWGGLWEPPCAPLANEEISQARALAIARERFGLRITAPSQLSAHKHELTHRRYRFFVLQGTAATGSPKDRDRRYEDMRWMTKDELSSVGLAAWASRLVDS